MSYREIINNTSGFFFFIGACLYKAQYIPIPLASAIFKMLALGCYLIGYVFWGIAFSPNHITLFGEWSWITTGHLHHVLSAIIGLVATLLCMLALLNPILMLIGLWGYVISNVFWCIAEYNQLCNSPNPHSSAQQAMVGYAMCMTLIAITIAIIAIFPPSFLLICVSGGICAAIGLFGLYFFSQSREESNKPIFENSYQQIDVNLGNTKQLLYSKKVCYSQTFYQSLHADTSVKDSLSLNNENPNKVFNV